MNSSRSTLVLLAAAFVFTACTPAYGYIDGGTGSMLLQVAVSGVLGALFVARSVLSSIPARFRKIRAAQAPQNTEPEIAKAA